jgi:hypothetical protein
MSEKSAGTVPLIRSIKINGLQKLGPFRRKMFLQTIWGAASRK